ncbi:MAG: addiction module toxin RelE [Cellvibrionales bacterium]|nr:MAG: addiction module toxin RelE [Cellvibrionales bacterium]
MAKVSTVLQTPLFRKTVKKLKPNQKKELDAAIKRLIVKPTLGELKKGDLAFLRVYKFKMSKQLTLLGYSYDDGALTLELIALATHENSYRNVKRRS